MPEIFEKIALFFDRIKSVKIWDRVLPWRWRAIRTLSYEAYSEYKHLMESHVQKDRDLEQGRTTIATVGQENQQLKLNNVKSEKELEDLRGKLDSEKTTVIQLKETLSTRDETIRQWEKDLTNKQSDITILQDKIERLSQESTGLKEELASLKESEASIRKQYEDKMTTLDRTQKRIEEERKKEEEDQHSEEIKKITSLKENWGRHQDLVKETIKSVCQRHVIEYVEKPPFKGNPDNTIKICDEYVVFDAKSPGTEDMSAFSKYILTQADSIKKYAKQENVKTDIFLVVPSNTVDVIEQFSFNMGDYNVYVVTVDALEPIILALRRIEDYEFAKELTPEERENICRIIGKFAHTAKRRIQIDHFFARQFLDVLTKCESDVPSDLLEKAVEFEMAEKLNPPLEKRTKRLPSKELVKDTGRIRREAEAKDVVFPKVIDEGIKALPLYEENQQKESNQENK